MRKAFVEWLFSDPGFSDMPDGPGCRIFFLVFYLLLIWWSVIGGILVLQGRV